MELKYLVGFNVYSNRQIIKYFSLDEYDYHSQNHYDTSDINFNPNDGVNTENVVNWDIDGEAPDYLIAYDLNGNIVSRWFVVEWTRIRGRQYKATLRRDVIADNYEYISQANIFFQRGPISNPNNPLIFNTEGMSFNQIKKDQRVLKDETNCAWIVGYLSRDYSESKNVTSIPVFTRTFKSYSEYGIILNDPSDVSKGGVIKAYPKNNVSSLIATFEDTDRVPILRRIGRRYEDGITIDFEEKGSLNDGYAFRTDLDERLFELMIQEYNEYPNLKTTITTDIDIYHNEYASYENLQKIYDGMLININGQPYRIRIKSTKQESIRESSSNNRFATYYNTMVQLCNGIASKDSRLIFINKDNPLMVGYELYTIELSFEQAIEYWNTRTVQFNSSNTRRKCSDATYDIFCMRYNLENLRLAQSIWTNLGDNIYDIQILPYCPSRYAIPLIEGRQKSDYLENVDYNKIINSEGSDVDYLIWCDMSSDQFVIEETVTIKNRTSDVILNQKISNECDLYRLSSPNMSSSFEFSPAKNGNVTNFVVSYTYKPLNPYIRIRPSFANLYGQDYKDARGLILSGDFSIDRVSNAWINYQIQNKNYENIFNTKIKSMDYQHDQSLISNIVGLGTSTAKGIIGGAIAGNPVSVGLGAASGLTTGITNLVTGENKYKDQRQLSIDLYNYELGNIKAQPDTMNKISAYNIDNNYYPVIEYFTASDEEIEMFKNKIKFQSYKLMKIGKIEDFGLEEGLGNIFVKGEVIRIGIYDDDHMANEIYNEIYKGVYL